MNMELYRKEQNIWVYYPLKDNDVIKVQDVWTYYALGDNDEIKVQNKWVYYAFGGNDEIELACLGVHFPVAEAYEGVDFEEDFSAEEGNDTL